MNTGRGSSGGSTGVRRKERHNKGTRNYAVLGKTPLDSAVECSRLTLPYLIRYDDREHEQHKTLFTPWQSIGAKAVSGLSAKLMLALLPPQTSFFKLQVNDSKLGTEMPAEMRSELELSFSKIERMIMDYINASSDRGDDSPSHEASDRRW